jgi:hypothetical protein
MPFTSDTQTRDISHHAVPAVGVVIRDDNWEGGLRCPYKGCECDDNTHVVDAVWERDPSEGDRRWVRLEVRCEMGRGYLLLIRNHAGHSRLEYQLLDGEVSPFTEGARW